jgi:hypothetical protein
MKRLYFKLGLIQILILLGFSVQLKSEPTFTDNKYDICELFMDSKPIINYDLLFGDVIKASSFFMVDRKQPCTNYTISCDKQGRLMQKKISHLYSGLEVIRDYKYNENGLISEVTEQKESFKKKISFSYNKNSMIYEVREEVIEGGNDPLFNRFDYLKYKIDTKGNIIEVRGVNEKMLGISTEVLMLKAYDYDENNRLKAIRDFMNPKETQIFSYNDYVNK